MPFDADATEGKSLYDAIDAKAVYTEPVHEPGKCIEAVPVCVRFHNRPQPHILSDKPPESVVVFQRRGRIDLDPGSKMIRIFFHWHESVIPCSDTGPGLFLPDPGFRRDDKE
jgi:hypothetical protein